MGALITRLRLIVPADICAVKSRSTMSGHQRPRNNHVRLFDFQRPEDCLSNRIWLFDLWPDGTN